MVHVHGAQVQRLVAQTRGVSQTSSSRSPSTSASTRRWRWSATSPVSC